MKSEEPLELGAYLDSGCSYFLRATDLLEDCGKVLTIAWFAALVSVGPEPPDLASTHIFWFLKHEKWHQARAAAQAVVARREFSDVPTEVLVNSWMARRECGENITGEVENWDPPDNERRYRLAKAALLRDEDAFRRVVFEYKRELGSVPKEIREWPLVEAMSRERPAVRGLLSQPGTRPSPKRKRR